MREIEARGLRESLLRSAKEKPFLGICIGMQVLYESSEESETLGLGILRGRVRKLPMTEKVPHIGWNIARQTCRHSLMHGTPENGRFYFIHSYYAPPDAHTIAVAEYGESLTAAAAKENIVAVQFHPEKSAEDGATILKNFVAM